LIIIRFGNAMWTPRGFEIWMFKWPRLVWSFSDIPKTDREAVCAAEPWRSTKRIIFYRATGAYSMREFRVFLKTRLHGVPKLAAYLIALFPGKLVNTAICAVGLLSKNLVQRTVWYELLRSKNATWIMRVMSKTFRRDGYELWARSLAARSEVISWRESAD